MRFAMPNNAHKAQMRIYGILCLIVGVVFLFIYQANSYSRNHGGHDLSYVLKYGIALSILGVLLLALRVWAELFFALSLVAVALGFVYGIIADFRTAPEVLYNVPVVFFLLIPAFFSLQRLRSGAYFQRGA
jgi:hypothetical protein